MLAQQPARDILEIGATPGHFTEILVRAGYRVAAVDLFPAERATLWRRLGVTVQLCNIEEQVLPYPDQSFDAVIFSEVIEHLNTSPLAALREMTRVLRPGGRLIISTPNQLYCKSRAKTMLDIVLGRPFEQFASFERSMQLSGSQRYYNHSRLYTMPELRWLAEQAGLAVQIERFVDAWERVGVEAERLRTNPLRVSVKAALIGVGLVQPALRSMLLLVAQRPAVPEPATLLDSEH